VEHSNIKECIACLEPFSIEGIKHGNKRKYCFTCVPAGLTRYKYVGAIMAARTQIARRGKLERGCDICSYNTCGSALEWHHPEDNKSEYNPSALAQSSWERYHKETEKCVLLCANCHREVHELDGRIVEF